MHLNHMLCFRVLRVLCPALGSGWPSFSRGLNQMTSGGPCQPQPLGGGVMLAQQPTATGTAGKGPEQPWRCETHAPMGFASQGLSLRLGELLGGCPATPPRAL